MPSSQAQSPSLSPKLPQPKALPSARSRFRPDSVGIPVSAELVLCKP